MGLLDLIGHKYPFTDFHELNLDWCISAVLQLQKAFEDFSAGNKLIFANPLQHDLTKTYAKNTIVVDSVSGTAYLSLDVVPVGVQLDNADYWLPVFDFASYVTRANKNFTDNYFSGTDRTPIPLVVGDWVVLDDVLYKVAVAMAADDLFEIGTNIIHFTVEQFLKDFITSVNQTLYNYSLTIQQYKNDIDASELAYRQQLAQDIANTTASLQAQLDAAIAGATVDSEVINARVGWKNFTYSTLGDAIRDQITRISDYSKYLNDLMDTNDLIYDTGVTGAFLNNDGTTTPSTSFVTTGFIPVTAGKTYKIQRGNNATFTLFRATYDNTQTLIGYAALTISSDETDYLIPSGTAYIKFCVSNVVWGNGLYFRDKVDQVSTIINNVSTLTANVATLDKDSDILNVSALSDSELIDSLNYDLLYGSTVGFLKSDGTVDSTQTSFVTSGDYIPFPYKESIDIISRNPGTVTCFYATYDSAFQLVAYNNFSINNGKTTRTNSNSSVAYIKLCSSAATFYNWIARKPVKSSYLYNYYGEPLDVSKDSLSIEKLFTVDKTVGGNVMAAQGCAIFDNVLFLALSDWGNNPPIDIIKTYSANSGAEIATISATIGHGNSMQFSNEYYDAADRFPLLYISGTLPDSGYFWVYIYRVSDDNAAIARTLRFDVGTMAAMQAAINNTRNELYTIASPSGTSQPVTVSIWDLGTLTANGDGSYTPLLKKSFVMPAMGLAWQEMKVYKNKLLLMYSAQLTPDTTIYVIDVDSECIVSVLNDFTTDIINGEAEGIEMRLYDNEYKMILLMQSGDTYKLSF